MGSLLTVRDLKVNFFTYYGVVNAVNGVSFTTEDEEILGIVGESGSGKSVTAQTIMGLIQPPGYVVGGEINYHGSNLLELSEEEWGKLRGNEITMCFQNPGNALNPVLTIGEQLIRVYRRHTKKATKKEAERRSVELLAEVNIPDAQKLLERYPHQLSGGMCQRVMIVMSLICEPNLLLLDEPTTGLDVTVQKQLLQVLRSLRQKTDASQLMITHDLGVIANICDRVVVMYGGRVMELARVDTIFGASKHPYTQALLKSIPEVGEKSELHPIPGTVPEALDLPDGCPFNPRCSSSMKVCESETPKLINVDSGHKVSCHLVGGE